MTVTQATQVVDIKPDLTVGQWTAILEAVSSPALAEAESCYNAVVLEGVSSAFALAIFANESTYGTLGICHDYETKNPGNCRTSSIGVAASITDPVKGTYVKYPNWTEGFRDLAHRLTDARFDYRKAEARTIGQIMPLWAPSSDGNSPTNYIATVVALMSKWIQTTALTPAGGSHAMFDLTSIVFNQSPNYNVGGNSCQKIVIHSTEGGYDSSVGWLLSKASQASAHYVINEDGSQCTQLVHDTDIAWHTGNWAYNTSCIGIEHSWFSDGRNGQPPDSLYQAGANLAANLCKRHGIQPLRGTTIIAHGEIPPPNNHTDPGPRWDWDKFMGYFWSAYNAVPHSDPAVIVTNGFALGHGFLAYWNSVHVPNVQHPLGLPISNEMDWVGPSGVKQTVQVFERGVLGFDGNIVDPNFRTQGLLIGAEWLKAHSADIVK